MAGKNINRGGTVSMCLGLNIVLICVTTMFGAVTHNNSRSYLLYEDKYIININKEWNLLKQEKGYSIWKQKNKVLSFIVFKNTDIDTVYSKCVNSLDNKLPVKPTILFEENFSNRNLRGKIVSFNAGSFFAYVYIVQFKADKTITFFIELFYNNVNLDSNQIIKNDFYKIIKTFRQKIFMDKINNLLQQYLPIRLN